MRAVSAWGRLSAEPHHLVTLSSRHQTIRQGIDQGLPHGMGRSYGDVCLNPKHTLWLTTGLNKFIDFDASRGRLTAESGVLLQDIQQTFVPRGWMLPVTPGTQFVTLGGAIANDVHGKNHHVMGTFGKHVLAMTLLRTDGTVHELDWQTNPQWMRATIGGLGLTGLITQATLQLRPVRNAWLACETIPFRELDEFFDLADASEPDWEYTVSWIDCLSKQSIRGIFMRGNHSPKDPESPHPLSARRRSEWRIDFPLPFSLVNPLSLRLFNTAYYARHAINKKSIYQHYQDYFYPLDNIHNWNRIYGSHGFYQYQCVLPQQHARPATQELLNVISRSGQGSFLAVLKTFGDQPAPGLLSFPMKGVTLALDFPNRGEPTLELFEKLDAIVLSTGGRLYPAKDARMSRAMFESGYGHALPEFLNYRDPGIHSAMSRRLMGSP